MWWRLTVLAVATVGLIALLFLPLMTVKVTVDLPPDMHGVSATQVGNVLSISATAIGVVLLALISPWRCGWRRASYASTGDSWRLPSGAVIALADVSYLF